MDICEQMLKNSIQSTASNFPITPEEKLLNIQNELLWGLTYRNYKENEKNKPMKPMHSPINIPFELCRANLLLGSKNKAKERAKNEEKMSVTEEKVRPESSGKKIPKKVAKKRRFSTEKPTLLERSIWSQDKYMDFLSNPNPKFSEEPTKKKYKKRCELEPCPPRFIQLAVPNKRRVFANWKDYADRLPAETLMRFEEILHTDQNLEPREARYYYKKLDKQKKRELKKKRLLAEKKKRLKEKDTDWLKSQIEFMATEMVEYIQDEPLISLNYKQMLISDGILERLEETNIMKKPSRKTKNDYKKTIIEASDKFAIWIDTLTKFVDIQAIDSDVDIPPVSLPSLMGLGEGESSAEGESEEFESSEEGLGDSELFETRPDEWGEEFGGGDDELDDESDKHAAEGIIDDLFKPGGGGGGVGEDDINEILEGLDGDALDVLIKILGHCSDEFLDGIIDNEKMPNVTYRVVLEKLKQLRDGLEADDGKPFLEKILIDWAVQNDPDQVNDEILAKIHKVAGILGDLLSEKKPTVPAKEGEKPEDEVPPSETDEGASGAETGGEESEIPKDPTTPTTEEGETPPPPVADEGATPQEPTDEGGEGPIVAPEGPTDEAEKEKPAAEPEVEETPQDEAAEGETPATDTPAPETEPGETPETPAAETDEAETPGAGIAGAETPQEEPGDTSEAEEGGEAATGGIDGDEETVLSDHSFGFEVTDGTAEADESDFGAGSGGLFGEAGEEGISEFEEPFGIYGEGEEEGEEGEILIKPPPKVPGVPAVSGVTAEGIPEKVGELDGKVIKGHKPSKVFEHSPDTVCCLSLKTWAVWLLEITHNAHNWTKWMSCVIQKIREYASIVRGDVKDAQGNTKLLRKADWRKFIKETEESVVQWKQYSDHVKDLSQNIVENFHGKSVNCCPKCLQDHLITNVVTAHDTLQSLTEAISCAAYWQKSLDQLMEKTCELTDKKKEEAGIVVDDSSSEEFSDDDDDDDDRDVELDEVYDKSGDESDESDVYEIEALEEDDIDNNPLDKKN